MFILNLLPVLQDGSNVIFVSSLGARSAVGTLAAYAAAKGAIDTLVKQFAAALGPRGIRVNAVYCLKAAVAAGEVLASTDVHEIAASIHSSSQGAIPQSKVEQSVKPLERFKYVLFSQVLH